MTHDEAKEALHELFDANGKHWHLNAAFNGTYELVAECWEYPDLKLEVLHRMEGWDKKRRKLFIKCMSKHITGLLTVELSVDNDKFITGLRQAGDIMNRAFSTDTPYVSFLEDGIPVDTGAMKKSVSIFGDDEQLEDESMPEEENEASAIEQPPMFTGKSTVIGFYSDCLMESDEHGLYNSDAYYFYMLWCESNGFSPVSRPYFREVMSAWVKPVKEGNNLVYHGIGLAPEWKDRLEFLAGMNDEKEPFEK